MNKIYSRLAFTNIKNNKTLYMPYIISGMVMIAMFYVMMFLNNSKGLGKVPGAEILVDIMGLGCGIIAIFSYIFLFYTNSFIIKRRKKEVGIYNILGMEKRHIARVLIIETLTVVLAAIVSGIITSSTHLSLFISSGNIKGLVPNRLSILDRRRFILFIAINNFLLSLLYL